METSNHFDSCEAPICQENIDKEAIWYPGEMVCTKKPLSFFQKRQINIIIKEGIQLIILCKLVIIKHP